MNVSVERLQFTDELARLPFRKSGRIGFKSAHIIIKSINFGCNDFFPCEISSFARLSIRPPTNSERASERNKFLTKLLVSPALFFVLNKFIIAVTQVIVSSIPVLDFHTRDVLRFIFGFHAINFEGK